MYTIMTTMAAMHLQPLLQVTTSTMLHSHQMEENKDTVLVVDYVQLPKDQLIKLTLPLPINMPQPNKLHLSLKIHSLKLHLKHQPLHKLHQLANKSSSKDQNNKVSLHIKPQMVKSNSSNKQNVPQKLHNKPPNKP